MGGEGGGKGGRGRENEERMGWGIRKMATKDCVDKHFSKRKKEGKTGERKEEGKHLKGWW